MSLESLAADIERRCNCGAEVDEVHTAGLGRGPWSWLESCCTGCGRKTPGWDAVAAQLPQQVCHGKDEQGRGCMLDGRHGGDCMFVHVVNGRWVEVWGERHG